MAKKVKVTNRIGQTDPGIKRPGKVLPSVKKTEKGWTQAK